MKKLIAILLTLCMAVALGSAAFADGDMMGAILDRNGLRPSRYYVMDDGRVILSSEVGVLPLDERHILKKEELHPGKILLADIKQERIICDQEIKEIYAKAKPFGEWLDSGLLHLSDLRIPNRKEMAVPIRIHHQR